MAVPIVNLGKRPTAPLVPPSLPKLSFPTEGALPPLPALVVAPAPPHEAARRLVSASMAAAGDQPETSPPTGQPAPATLGAGDRAAPQSSASDLSEIERYLAILRAEIQRRLIYPAAARRLGLSGEVLVRFSVDTAGLADGDGARVIGGAEDPVLREGALTTIRRLGDLPAPPKGPITVELPIRFTLTGR